MSDLISRQEAISAICNACGKIDCDKMDKCEKLQLSPANISETPNSSDTISRQQAIDELVKMLGYCFQADEEVLDAVVTTVRELPSAQPEVKQISYTDCANAMLMMWMDKVLTDGEYNRIMDKLNEHEKKKGEDNE